MSDGQSDGYEKLNLSTEKTFEGWILVAKNQAISFSGTKKENIFFSPLNIFEKIQINNLNYELLELARIKYNVYDDNEHAYNILEYCGSRLSMTQAKFW